MALPGPVASKKPVPTPAKKPPAKKPGTSTSGSSPTPTGTNQKTGMNFGQVEDIWIQAGGNAQAAQMAAAVADASSGLNPEASRQNPDGTTSVGLWLIPKNGSPPGSTDPVSNGRAAVQLSNGGTDWSQWCVTWSDNNCGIDGGTYLGDGSNALASLAGQSGTFNSVPGASPSGTGVGASAATVTPPTTTSSTSHTILYIALGIALIAAVFFMTRRKTSQPEGESETSSQAPWTPAEETAIQDTSKSGKQLSQELGRSVRSIEVRRNQQKQ